MSLYKVVIEEEIIAYQHTTYEVEADNEDEAYDRCVDGCGKIVDQELVDTGGSNGNTFDLISIDLI